MPSFFRISASSPDLLDRPVELQDMVAQSLHWLSNHSVQILVAVAAGVILYLVMTLTKHGLCRLGSLDAMNGFGTIIRRTLRRTAHAFMALAAARLVVGYAHPPAPVMETVSFLFTVAAMFQGAIWAREIILGLIERRTEDDGHGQTLSNAMGLIRILVTVALFAIAAIMVLDNLGVNVTGLVAGLGIGGIAIGLAAQGIFSDLFAALSIIFDKPFRQGETIQYDQTTAAVERIGLKSTRLRSVDGEAKIISNANLLQKEITNYRDVARRRYSMPISLIFQTPPDKADRIPALLKEIVESNGGEYQRAAFLRFGASSLDFEFFFFVDGHDIDAAAQVRHKVGIAILRRFAEEGIKFAYPTQTTFTAAPDGTMVYPYAQPRDNA